VGIKHAICLQRCTVDELDAPSKCSTLVMYAACEVSLRIGTSADVANDVVATDNLSCMLDVAGRSQVQPMLDASSCRMHNTVVLCVGTIMLQRAQQSRMLVALLGRGEGRGAGNSFAKLCHVDAQEGYSKAIIPHACRSTFPGSTGGLGSAGVCSYNS
jgi:hypothetical protein